MSTVLWSARLAPLRRFPLPTLIFAASCATPERAPLGAEEVELALAERDHTPELLVAAVESADLAPFALGALPKPGATPDLDDAPFWRASALAYAPSVRAARRALAAARERSASAGRPGAIEAFVETEELDDLEPGRAVLSFDLIGLLGLGPAASARGLADATVRAARAELELAAWEARIDVDRARAELAAARAELAALDELALEGAWSEHRVDALDAHGRLAPESLAMARLAEHRLLHRRAELEAGEAAARAALARAAGLGADARELDHVTGATLVRLADSAGPPSIPERRALLTQSPRLRAALVEYALAEARLFDEAAARWPELRVGPHLLWRMEEFLVGAMVETAVPWPGALEGRVRAAEEERLAAREAVEDLLLEEESRARAARERWLAAHRALIQHVLPADGDSAGLLRASAALFSVDPASIGEWARALEMRVDVLAELFATRLAEIRAALELERAVGPRPPDGTDELEASEAEVRA